MAFEPSNESKARVTCIGCRHLVTTWDQHFPYGCRLFDFQSKVQPAIEVRRETGEECSGYAARAPRAG
jgi:hypothetical protein